MSEEKNIQVSAAMLAEMVTTAVDAAMKAQPVANNRGDYVPFIQDNLLPEIADHLVRAMGRPELLKSGLGEFPGKVDTRGSGEREFEVTEYPCSIQTRLVAAPGKAGGRADGSDIMPSVALEAKLSNSIFGGWVRLMTFRSSPKSLQGLTAMYQNGEKRRG